MIRAAAGGQRASKQRVPHARQSIKETIRVSDEKHQCCSLCAACIHSGHCCCSLFWCSSRAKSAESNSGSPCGMLTRRLQPTTGYYRHAHAPDNGSSPRGKGRKGEGSAHEQHEAEGTVSHSCEQQPRRWTAPHAPSMLIIRLHSLRNSAPACIRSLAHLHLIRACDSHGRYFILCLQSTCKCTLHMTNRAQLTDYDTSITTPLF